MSGTQYKIRTTKHYEKEFRKIPLEIQNRTEQKIKNDLVYGPYSYEPLEGIKYKGARKLRIGNYRILFVINEKNKEIILYEVFKREIGYR